MKAILFVALCLMTTGALADHYVRGYTRSNGTYVAPHMQSNPDQYRFNNYSSQGNTNPYTGQAGHERNEYSNPPAYNQPRSSYFGSQKSNSNPW
jgi:hypothetical protein